MLAQLRTFALIGIDAVPVDVEVDTARTESLECARTITQAVLNGPR